MPEFVPTRYVRAPVITFDVAGLFSDAQFAATIEKVIRYLVDPYVKHADGSYDRVSRPGVVTEQFCVGMPTIDAYAAEIELCQVIRAYSLGEVSGEKIKSSLQRYLETHILVYSEDSKGDWRAEIKSGFSRRTGRDIALYQVSDGADSVVLNGVQVHLYMRLEKAKGNNAQFTVSKL